MSESFMNITTIVISNIQFILAMLIILMVAACFLGRYIVISKKMIIGSCGVILLYIVFIVIYTIVINNKYADLMDIDDISQFDFEQLERLQKISIISEYVINGLVFLYAFVFYLIAFKARRLLCAIESTVCLWLFYNYIQGMLLYAYGYISGGDLDSSFATLNDIGYDSSTMLFRFTLISFASVLLILLILYFGYYRRKRFYVLSIKSRIFFVVWLVIFNFFPAIPAGGETIEEKYKLLSYVFGVLIPIIGFVAPALLVLVAADKSLKEKNEYQETYLAAQLAYIEQYKKSQTETRAFRHDIINNLSLANMLMEEGKTEEAGAHIKSLLGNVSALSPQYITGDEMLDCIVAMKAAKMDELGINFTSDGVVDGGLNMKPMDICSIFANAMDNAIEAAQKSSHDSSDEHESQYEYNASNGQEASPYVSLRIKRTGQFFILKISNSTLTKVDVDRLMVTSGYTSKKDKEHHGFGLRNISRTVEKYDGFVKADSDEKEFSLSIMIPRTLPLPQQERE